MKKKTKKRIIIIFSGVISFLLMVIVTQSILNRHRQNEKVDVINRYIEFQGDVEAIVYNNITLINGYLAYIKSDVTVNQEKTNTYLGHLIEGHAYLIRNVGVIEDTTIVWNYPLEGNEASIGVDLATIATQRDAILLTKDQGNPIFQGPVNLVQGGIGFIVRLPVERNGLYWGQVSLVIDGNAFYHAIEDSARENGIEIALYDLEDYPNENFYQTDLFNKQGALLFELKVDLIDWMVEVRPMGGWYDFSNMIVAIIVLSLTVAIGVSFSVNRHLLVQENTKYQANHDFLTRLWNRNYLDDYQAMVFEQAKEESLMMGIIVIDIDKFKSINDNYGHHAGDQVLKWVAKKLRKVAQMNEVVFRLGGDEFLIVMPYMRDVSYVYDVYERIGLEMSEEIKIKNEDLVISLSIGHAVYPDDGEDIDELMRLADKMMYDSKNKKRL